MIRPLVRFATTLIILAALNTLPLRAQHGETASEFGPAPTQSWPTYNGDFSGRRFSELSQINSDTVKQLELQWSYEIGKKSAGARNELASAQIKSTPLLLDGRLYFTVPDHVFAVDARTGKELWTYSWVDKGGHLLGNRGLGFYNGTLYFVGPDGWLIALDALSGKERWRKELVDARKQYFTTTAPMIVKNHLLIGVGGDAMDIPGFLLAVNPENGEAQWRWNSTPRTGDPELKTWPNSTVAEHGGGMTWLPGTYDATLNTIYWGTGNTNPVYAGSGRAGSNLWTASIVALDVDTGKLKWYFQTSPHDTHDWDNVETPVLFDQTMDGKPRKLLAQAARNGYFVVLDRVTGKSLVTTPYVPLNWSKGISPRGEPIPDPAKEPSVAGSLSIGSATNWFPPSYSQKSGLFYVNGTESWEIYYLTDLDPKPAGYAGTTTGVGEAKHFLDAIDTKGHVAWRHDFPTAPGSGGGANGGVLSTAGGLVVAGDIQRNLIIFRDADGAILWHDALKQNVSNGPITVMQDGKQWLFVGAGGTMYAYAIK